MAKIIIPIDDKETFERVRKSNFFFSPLFDNVDVAFYEVNETNIVKVVIPDGEFGPSPEKVFLMGQTVERTIRDIESDPI